MVTAAELDLPAFDYTADDLRGDRFHEVMGELIGQGGWLARNELGWLFVLDREAATFFLRSKAMSFPSAAVAEAFGITDGPIHDAISKNIITIEGDDHRRLRNLVNPAFNPREADRYRPLMGEHLAELWQPLADRQSCEFVADFSAHYPARMIAAVVGAPVADAPRLHDWANSFQQQFDPLAVLSHREEIERAVVEFGSYVEELIAPRREDPADDLASKLMTATHEGDELSEDECVNLIMNVFAGGIDTTVAQLAHGIRLFATRPEQWRWLAEQPTERAAAVTEEVLRYEPITPFTARMAAEEVTYRDVTLPAGTVVMISTFAGNRDPEAYEEPWSFDVSADRDREKPMTFGAGIHNCLGANLARAELQEAFAFLAPRLRELELDGEPVYDSIAGVYGLRELPIRYRPAEPARAP